MLMDFPPLKMMSIDRRIQNCQRMMVAAHKNPCPDKEEQIRQIKILTFAFKALLTEKARQEAIHNICNDYCCNTQHTSTSQAHDSRPSIRIGDILKQKIARC